MRGFATISLMSRRVLGFAALLIASALLVRVGNVARAQNGQSLGPRALDTKNSITYFISDGDGQAGYRASDQELAHWALEAWQRSVGKKMQFQSAPESRALIRLYWVSAGEGEFGETRPLMVGGMPGAAVFIDPDVDSLGPDLARQTTSDALLRDSIVYLTCLHELGHALGLMHTQDFHDIMYFFGYGGDVVEYFERYREQLHSRSDIAKVSGLSAGDVRRIRALYDVESRRIVGSH